jgi:hypothetical protein
MPAASLILDGNYRPVSQVIGTTFTASSTGLAAAANSATLPADTTGKTTYLTGFSCVSHAPGAVVGTAATPITITGLSGGTWSIHFVENTTYGGELNVAFPQPIPASAANTAIVLSIPALTGGAVTSISMYGFQL